MKRLIVGLTSFAALLWAIPLCLWLFSAEAKPQEWWQIPCIGCNDKIKFALGIQHQYDANFSKVDKRLLRQLDAVDGEKQASKTYKKYAQLSGGMMFPGPGMPASAGASYQGPGDVFSTNIAGWYSPARAYNAAYANGTNPLADLVDANTGAVAICTLRVLTTGFADLAGSYCTGSTTPATACAAAAGGFCRVSKLYDQSGNSRDVVDVTVGNMPALVFSSTPTGTLPAINCGTAAATNLRSTAAFTQALPITLSSVFKRVTGTAVGEAIGGNTGTYLGSGGSASLASVNGGTALTATLTDNTWGAVQGLANGNGTSSAINVNGSDTLGAAGTTGLGANNISICRGAGSAQLNGLVAEAGIWFGTSTATDRGNLSTNQHGANGYNF